MWRSWSRSGRSTPAAGAEGRRVTKGLPCLGGGACGQSAGRPLVCSVVTRTTGLRRPRPGNRNPWGGQAVCLGLGPVPAGMTRGAQLMERPATCPGLQPPTVAFIRSPQQGDRQGLSPPVGGRTSPGVVAKPRPLDVAIGHRVLCPAAGAERLPRGQGRAGQCSVCPLGPSRASQLSEVALPAIPARGDRPQPSPRAEQTPRRQLLPA